jgi:hypothetical protein
MALKGKSVLQPIAYIPEVERSNGVDPTIFWIVPKNMKGTYTSLELFAKGADTSSRGQRVINPHKMAAADVKDFLNFCKKVENYQFSETFPELNAKGVIPLIEDPETMAKLYEDIDPTVFQEIQSASADWGRLDEGHLNWSTFMGYKNRTNEE